MQHAAKSVLVVSLAIPLLASASEPNYPTQIIRVVTAVAGSGNDFAGRILAKELTERLRQSVIIDNRGIVAIELATRAQPDGYTLLFYGDAVWLSQFVQKYVSYDPVKDLAPITLATRTPDVLVVHPSLPVKSVGDLIALARARPGELNYGSGSLGASPHVAAELFKAKTKIDFVRVSYKGSGPAMNALMSGEVQLMFPTAASVASHLASGRLKALAVTTAQPTALLPGVPTIAASGVPGYQYETLAAFFAPAGTPSYIVNRLNQEIVSVLRMPDVKARLFSAGMETVASSPDELSATMRTETATMSKILKSAGIQNE